MQPMFGVRKAAKKLVLLMIMIWVLLPVTVFAQSAEFAPPSFTLLPELRLDLFPTEVACALFLNDFENEFYFGATPTMGGALHKLSQDVFGTSGANQPSADAGDGELANRFFVDDVLACAVKTGRIKFAYVAYFATFFLSLGTVAAGTVAMLFVIIGGYQYVFSGISDGKEDAKKTIGYALGGLALSSFAWIIVQLVLSFLSS